MNAILGLPFVHAGSLADLLGHLVFVALYEANEPTEFVFHAHFTISSARMSEKVVSRSWNHHATLSLEAGDLSDQRGKQADYVGYRL